MRLFYTQSAVKNQEDFCSIFYPLGHQKGLTSPRTRGFGVDTGQPEVDTTDLSKPLKTRFSVILRDKRIVRSSGLSGEDMCRVGRETQS